MPKIQPHGRIRPASRNSRFEKLRAMRCYDQVYERIRQGWPLTELARYIQDQKQEYTDVTQSALLQVLTEFRKTIPAADLVAARLPADFQQAKAALDEGIDEIKELEELYRIQMGRVKIDLEIEKKLQKLVPNMTSEIKEARSILESIAEIKMELGVMKRAPQEHVVEIAEERLEGDLTQNFGSDAAKKILSNPESRRRVSGVIERLVKLTSGAALDNGQVPSESE